jgi:putative oxidoreductase
MMIRSRILTTESSGSIFFIRLMVGVIFLSEGIQKFVNPFDLGSGHFLRMGLPMPELSAYVTGIVEIACSVFVLAGLYTRLATIPLLIITIFSLVAIQLPLMIDKGLWGMLHAARVDWCMLLGNCYLLMKGGGCWSLDRKWWK